MSEPATAPQAVLLQCFERVGEVVHDVVDRLTEEQAQARPTEDANPIGWLLWHLARVQDVQLAHLAGTDDVYPAFADAFTGGEGGQGGFGFGMTSEQVGAFRASPVSALADYYDAVAARTTEILPGLTDLDRVIDDSYDPPVTVAARLVSTVVDVLQHAGQAAYVKGIVSRA